MRKTILEPQPPRGLPRMGFQAGKRDEAPVRLRMRAEDVTDWAGKWVQGMKE